MAIIKVEAMHNLFPANAHGTTKMKLDKEKEQTGI